MKKFNKFVLILSFVFALSFNMFANFGKAFAETSYKTTQEEIKQNGFITYSPFPYTLSLDLTPLQFFDCSYRLYYPNAPLNEINSFISYYSNWSYTYRCFYSVGRDSSTEDFANYFVFDIMTFGNVKYENNYIYLPVTHFLCEDGVKSRPFREIEIFPHIVRDDFYFVLRTKLDYYLPLSYNGKFYNFEMYITPKNFITNSSFELSFNKTNSIPFTFSVATIQPNFYFYGDGYDKTTLLNTFLTELRVYSLIFENIPTTYNPFTSIIFNSVSSSSFWIDIYSENWENSLQPAFFDSGSMENLETDMGVEFVFELYDFNLYPALNEGVSGSIVSGLPDTVSCAWYDIPCHLGNALVYFMKEFPLTKPIIDFIDSAFILLSLPFELLSQLLQLGGNSLFIGFVFLLVVMAIVRYFMR